VCGLALSPFFALSFSGGQMCDCLHIKGTIDKISIFIEYMTSENRGLIMPIVPIGRIVSDDTVVVRDSAAEAVQALLDGAPSNAVVTGMVNPSWPVLLQFNSPNNGDFTKVPNPQYIWDEISTNHPGKRLGFAKSIPISARNGVSYVLHLFVLGDNAIKARAQLFSVKTPTEQLDITDGFLLDSSFDPSSGATTPPFEWQNVRYYSIAFQNTSEGEQVIVSFEVQNYNAGDFNPGMLMFVADLYSEETPASETVSQ
jgi:hypothetical protein